MNFIHIRSVSNTVCTLLQWVVVFLVMSIMYIYLWVVEVGWGLPFWAVAAIVMGIHAVLQNALVGL